MAWAGFRDKAEGRRGAPGIARTPV